EWKDSSNKTNRFEAWWVSDREPLRWMMDGERLCLEWPDSDKPSTLAVAFGAVSSGEAQSALNGEAWTKFVRTELQKELLGKREAARSHDSENRATVGPHDSENRATVRPHDSENRATVGNRVGEVPLEIFETTSRVWFEGNGWAVDEIETPSLNRWKARTRVTGLAFYPDENAMAVCTWDGDVWRVTGFDSLGSSTPKIGWQRIATGLFQPLGILVLKDGMMVTCRDQLVKMRDLDGDHVIEDYVCFNSDHQVTEHFHEFAMGLQQDKLGNFLYAKSARHALKAVVPHHGTLLRVSPDGATTGILATGFRAANGVCLNPDGSFVVTDQEGHWNPKNRINWVEPGKFYGNMFGYHAVTDVSDAAMQPPLCWITNSFDRSPAELLWVDSQRWGSLNGSLLNLSYGYGRIYVVPFETVDGIKQGGMCALPIPDLPTGIVRGRFSPRDGQLYVGGMFAWASSRQDQEGGLYRIRPTGRSVDLPIALHVKRNNEKQPTVEIGFSDPLDRNSASDTKRYKIKAWDLRRSEKYGSDHYNERELDVVSALLLKDNKTIVITIPSLQPTWGMSIDVQLTTNDGREFKRTIHNSVHKIP
ncbi:MAG: cytochrome C oxidase Cbb3, partial [Pirellula sp.]